MSTLLFELGCEELPPKSLRQLETALATNVSNALEAEQLDFEQLISFSAPRRLAVQIKGVATKQSDRVEERRGPDVSRAFDESGKPTGAALGFAKGLGVSVEHLGRLETDKGTYLSYTNHIKGKDLSELIEAVIQSSLDALPIAKRMRSGALRTEFVRPVQWVMLMLDNQVLDARIQGLAASNQTKGHRFHSSGWLTVDHADNYQSVLKDAYVEPDFKARQDSILTQVNQAAASLDAQAVVPAELLEEVTALVDHPVALIGSFDESFLKVPQEALISTMQDNQKYFCVVDSKGTLKPHFVFITNIESQQPKAVVEGNEKVVRPRLSDAQFFFEQDQRTTLASRAEKLESQVFQQKLGSLWDKTQRVAKLAAFIAANLKPMHPKLNVEWVTRAAVLSKCDLASLLVGEFPELQGVAGEHYALIEGEPASIATAIREQYLPKGGGGELPETLEGMCLALADRLDTLVGIFAIGQSPSGSKDPFSLRRAAIGVLRILIERQLELNLVALIEAAMQGLAEQVQIEAGVREQVLEFIHGRYRAYYESQGVQVDSIQAVQAVNPHMPLDFHERLMAVQAFRQLEQSQSLAAANKRVAGILGKADQPAAEVDSQLLTSGAEKNLYSALNTNAERLEAFAAQSDYNASLKQLATLHAPIETFFEEVMVNTEDPALKANRLALLSQLRAQFLSVADIGLLQA